MEHDGLPSTSLSCSERAGSAPVLPFLAGPGGLAERDIRSDSAGLGKALLNPRCMKLKTLLVLALVAGLVVSASSATAAATRSTRHYRVDRLEAHWILPTKTAGDFVSLAVQVTRRTDVNTGEVMLSGVAGRGSCEEGAQGQFGCMTYFSSGWRVASFEADDAFATATVVLKRRDQRARVSWTTGAPFAWVPPFAENPSICPGGDEGKITTVYISGKNATAEGKVLGRAVSTASEYEEERTAERMTQTLETEECP